VGTGVDDGPFEASPGRVTCGRRAGPGVGGRRLPGMTIEVVPAQLTAVAQVLTASAERARLVGASVPGEGVGSTVGGPLAPAVDAVAETARTAADCLAAELRWLAGAVAGAADAWAGLDAGLLPSRGVLPR
jgi:hypothetical protein